MKSYKEFIEQMNKDYFIRKNNNSIILDGTESFFTRYSMKMDTIGKFLEFKSPDNTIITHCGSRMICEKIYESSLKCYDENLNEIFINPLKSSIFVRQGLLINFQIVVTRIGKKLHNIDKEWTKIINYTMEIIGSKNPNEYPLWSGSYFALNNCFYNGFYLENGDKLIFYAINPDFDIKNIEIKLEVDIFEKMKHTLN